MNVAQLRTYDGLNGYKKKLTIQIDHSVISVTTGNVIEVYLHH